MQKEFFQELQDILYEKNITIKFHSFQNFYEDFKSPNLFLITSIKAFSKKIHRNKLPCFILRV